MTGYPSKPYPICLAPACGVTFDLSQSQPRIWWCAGCRKFFDSELKAIPNKFANQARTHSARPIPVPSIPFENNIQDDQPED
jgi:hypothetical protein